jgi:hypothetical protein
MAAQTFDEAIAWHLDAHIMGASLPVIEVSDPLTVNVDGYEFLMQNCTHDLSFRIFHLLIRITDQEGDKICIFGIHSVPNS